MYVSVSLKLIYYIGRVLVEGRRGGPLKSLPPLSCRPGLLTPRPPVKGAGLDSQGQTKNQQSEIKTFIL